MYRFGETLEKGGFLELRKEGGAYLFSVGECFDDGEDGVCTPLFSFSKKISGGRVEELVRYLQGKL